MSLATRCPTCSTAFRVVQDQLRVSAGWVRCGRCGEVFNAGESLLDIDAEAAPPATSSPPGAAVVQRIDPTWQVPGRPASLAPPASSPPAPARYAPPPQVPPQPVPAPPEVPPSPRLPSSRAMDDDIADTRDAAAGAATDDVAGRVTDTLQADAAVRSFHLPPVVDVTQASEAANERDLVDTEQVDSAMSGHAGADLPPSLVPDRPDSLLDDDPARPDEGAAAAAVLPDFVRRADRAARWRRPWVRAMLSLVALALGAVLAVQLALVQRDTLAARVPALQPALAALCEASGCRIEPPRRIDQLAVESSGLARVEGAPLYRLSLVLRNRADISVLLPAVELTITDPAGQVVARRVLSPTEAGATRSTIDGGQELALAATLSVAERRLAGYTIELFYP